MAMINCPECGQGVSDRATSCIHCGNAIGAAQANVFQQQATQRQPAQQATRPQPAQRTQAATYGNPSPMPKIICIVGMILGIIVAAYGIVGIGGDIGVEGNDDRGFSTVGTVTFGGDFYTESYAATKAAADNVIVVAQNVEDVANLLSAYRIIPIAIGAFMSLFFALKYFEVTYSGGG